MGVPKDPIKYAEMIAKLKKPKSDAARKNMSYAAKSKPRSEAQLKHLRDMSDNHIGKHQSEEHRNNIRITKVGEKNPFYNKHHTPENCEIISNTHKDKTKTEEHKQKLGLSHIGLIISDETRKKISCIKQNRFATDPKYREIYRVWDYLLNVEKILVFLI